MGSVGSPEIWVPYLTNKDCSLGFCSMYCPQWCYIIDPPPPPPLNFSAGHHNPSSINFSSLVVAILGILVSAFVLVTYYVVIFKHCGNDNNGQRRSGGENPNNGYVSDNDENQNPRLNVAATGLDEALIKAIGVCKYKKGGGFVEGTDCSVCLSEFREDESLRLLPQCSHAFHIQCIDTWLRSHSNCPLCRANVVISVVGEIERPFNGESTVSGDQGRVLEHSEVIENNNINGGYSSVVMPPKSGSTSRTSLSSFSDLGNLEDHSVIEVRGELRRSISMDFLYRDQILLANEEDEEINVVNERESCSKLNESDKKGYTMKRSMSSGRFFLSRSVGVGRGKTNSFAV